MQSDHAPLADAPGVEHPWRALGSYFALLVGIVMGAFAVDASSIGWFFVAAALCTASAVVFQQQLLNWTKRVGSGPEWASTFRQRDLLAAASESASLPQWVTLASAVLAVALAAGIWLL